MLRGVAVERYEGYVEGINRIGDRKMIPGGSGK